MKRHRNHLRRKKPTRVRRTYSQKLGVSRADVARVERVLAGA